MINGLIIGKFRVFTNAHKRLIDNALKKCDNLVINITSNKKTQDTLRLRKLIIKYVYKRHNNIFFITNRSGFLEDVLKKSPIKIDVLFVGGDRKLGFLLQIKNSNLDLKIKVLKRNENDISATKIINNINNVKYYKSNTPKVLWKLHNIYGKIYKSKISGSIS